VLWASDALTKLVSDFEQHLLWPLAGCVAAASFASSLQHFFSPLSAAGVSLPEQQPLFSVAEANVALLAQQPLFSVVEASVVLLAQQPLFSVADASDAGRVVAEPVTGQVLAEAVAAFPLQQPLFSLAEASVALLAQQPLFSVAEASEAGCVVALATVLSFVQALLSQQPLFSVAEASDALLAQQPLFSVAEASVVLLAQQPLFSVAEASVALLAQQPLFSVAEASDAGCVVAPATVFSFEHPPLSPQDDLAVLLSPQPPLSPHDVPQADLSPVVLQHSSADLPLQQASVLTTFGESEAFVVSATPWVCQTSARPATSTTAAASDPSLFIVPILQCLKEFPVRTVSAIVSRAITYAHEEIRGPGYRGSGGMLCVRNETG